MISNRDTDDLLPFCPAETGSLQPDAVSDGLPEERRMGMQGSAPREDTPAEEADPLAFDELAEIWDVLVQLEAEQPELFDMV